MDTAMQTAILIAERNEYILQAHAEGLTRAKLAERFGMTVSRIGQIIRSVSAKPRPAPKPPSHWRSDAFIETARALRMQGLSIQAIAEELHVKKGVISGLAFRQQFPSPPPPKPPPTRLERMIADGAVWTNETDRTVFRPDLFQTRGAARQPMAAALEAVRDEIYRTGQAWVIISYRPVTSAQQTRFVYAPEGTEAALRATIEARYGPMQLWRVSYVYLRAPGQDLRYEPCARSTSRIREPRYAVSG